MGLVFLCAGAVLCAWQVRRDAARNQDREQALLVAGLPELQPRQVPIASDAWREGTWSGGWTGETVLLAGRNLEEQRAYGVVSVLALPGGERMMVDRGTVSADEAAAVVARAPSETFPIHGQLRVFSGDLSATPVAGHGTSVWPSSGWSALAKSLRSDVPTYLVVGGLGGSDAALGSLHSGYTPVPPRDDTSWYYTWQWAAVATLGVLAALPRPASQK